MMKTYTLLLTSTLLILAGCNRPADQPTSGSYNESTRLYTNPYFGLAFQVPQEWYVPEPETFDQLVQMGLQMVPTDLQDSLLTDSTNPLLFSVFRYPFDATEGYNLYLQVIADPLPDSIKSAEAYLKAARQAAERTRLRLHISELSEQVIDQWTYQSLTLSIHLGPIKLSQDYFIRIKQGYAFGFVISYSEPGEKEQLLSLLRSMEWDS